MYFAFRRFKLYARRNVNTKRTAAALEHDSAGGSLPNPKTPLIITSIRARAYHLPRACLRLVSRRKKLALVSSVRSDRVRAIDSRFSYESYRFCIPFGERNCFVPCTPSDEINFSPVISGYSFGPKMPNTYFAL